MPDGDIFVLKNGILDCDSKSDTVHCNLRSVSRDSYTLATTMEIKFTRPNKIMLSLY